MKYFRFMTMLLVAVTLAFTACSDDSGGGTGNSVITIAAIPGVVVPERDAAPVTTAIDTDQYTGTISWSPADDPFAAETVYTATITLTAKAGYTLTGVDENYFTVAGATATNANDSGIVTAVFPATGAAADIDVVFQSAVQIGGTSATAESTGILLNFDADPTTLSADNITVTGARKVSLSGTGTTRTLTIADINVANEGTVTVAITSPSGYIITGSPQTATVYRITIANMAIGMDYRGGKLAYILQSGDTGYDASVPHGIIAATADQDGGSGIQWGGYGADMSGTGYTTGTALGDGQSNTETIVDFFDTIYQSASPYATYYAYDWASLTTGTVDFTDGTNTYAMLYINNGNVAAKLCADYEVTVSGVTYDDWYLPSKDELNKLYLNKASVGGFADASYWSSSEGSANVAWLQDFYGGYQYGANKGGTYRVRAVRAF